MQGIASAAAAGFIFMSAIFFILAFTIFFLFFVKIKAKTTEQLIAYEAHKKSARKIFGWWGLLTLLGMVLGLAGQFSGSPAFIFIGMFTFTLVEISLYSLFAFVAGFLGFALATYHHPLFLLFNIFLTGTTLVFWHRYENNRERFDCEKNTEKLGGGIYEFSGMKYEVKVCKTGIDSWAQDTDVLAMMVYRQGSTELLAERLFDYYDSGAANPIGGVVQFGQSDIDSSELNHRPFDKSKLQNLYYGHSNSLKGDGFAGSLTMPPTTLDWIRARIP